jgi:hypothetical protein
MAKFARHDFLIKDLVVSMGAGARGGTWLPGPDDETPPSPISPIASVVAHLAHIEGVRGAITELVKAKRYDEIAAAFAGGDADGAVGNPALRAAIHEVGVAVVASAAFAALGGGAVGLPNPDCGGTSLETIPPTLTPVVHVGLEVHRVSELPRLKKQLAQTVAYVDRVAAHQAPRRDEVPLVRAQLEMALKDLGMGAVETV